MTLNGTSSIKLKTCHEFQSPQTTKARILPSRCPGPAVFVRHTVCRHDVHAARVWLTCPWCIPLRVKGAFGELSELLKNRDRQRSRTDEGAETKQATLIHYISSL